MLKNVIKEIQQKPLGYLTIICARPGDGRRTFAIELANDFVMKGFQVCFCSVFRTKTSLKNKLLPGVRVLNIFSHNRNLILKRLSRFSKLCDTVVLVDDLSSFMFYERLKKMSVGAYDEIKSKTEWLKKIKESAIQQGMRVVVTDTFPRASDTDDTSAIPCETLELCDGAYILYKESVIVNNLWNPYKSELKLKEINL